MNISSIVIRINKGEDDAVDWTVPPDQVTFDGMLRVFSDLLPNRSTTALDYEDEDGDKITVRSEEEMDSMIAYYINMMRDFLKDGEKVPPLVIYPRGKLKGTPKAERPVFKVLKAPEKRNIEGLKVETLGDGNDSATSSGAINSGMAACAAYSDSPMDECLSAHSAQSNNSQQGSSKQEDQDLGEILACGTITGADLHKIEILGTGNAGTVHKAYHRPTSLIIAVKEITLDITPEVQKQIMSELQILYKCDSPVIIGFYGAFFVENRISMCQEFMDGGSLDMYGQIPENILGRIAVAVIQGIQYLWNLKIMHRDVKPSNVLVNTSGQVKLCDFGVSVQLVDSIARTYVGTNAYMAPERIKGEEYRIQSDVWSFGVALYEMAAGKFPFEIAKVGAKPIDLFSLIIDAPPPQLPKELFSEQLVHFVSICMQKDSHVRPLPEKLLKHPLVAMYGDNNTVLVSQWVRQTLEELQIKRKQHACSA